MHSDAAIEYALTHTCTRCGTPPGWECCTVHGVPLIVVEGVPVHPERIGEQ